MSYDWLDGLVSRGEARCGRLFFTVIVVMMLILAASIYVRPATKCVVHGASYANLAENPFNFEGENALAFRILTPLISYLLGLRGNLILITNLLMAALLLVGIYRYFRAHAPRPSDALVAAAVLTFSLVTLTTVYYGGYTDSATYLIIFLMWIMRRWRPVFYLLFFLGLLNHESLLFLIPWFAYLSSEVSSSRKKLVADLLIGFGLTVVAYGLFREWIASHRMVKFSIEYYLNPLLQDPLHWFRKSYSYQGLGLFTVFKVMWVFPVMAALSLWRRRQQRDVFSMALLLACSLSQLVVAFDSSRMLTLGFMVMVIALEHLFLVNPYRFRELVGWIFLANLAVPQLYTARNIIEVMRSLPGDLLFRLLTK
jgi:hypothetical protein